MVILGQRTEASFKTIILFSQVELSKWLLEAFGLQKGPQLPLFRRLVKIKTTVEVAMFCTLGDNNNNNNNNNLITYCAGIHKNDQMRITNYKPIYNKRNNKNIYASALKI